MSGGQSVRVQRTYDHYTPPEPYYVLAFLGTPAPPQSVTAAGETLAEVASQSALDVRADVSVVVTF